jgi:hypothetical protein
MDNIQADYIARVNGLRADYLADQDAVQPARVDALEERLETIETEMKEKPSFTALRFEDLCTMVRELTLSYSQQHRDSEALRERLEKQEQLLKQYGERQLTTQERLEKLERVLEHHNLWDGT